MCMSDDSEGWDVFGEVVRRRRKPHRCSAGWRRVDEDERAWVP